MSLQRLSVAVPVGDEGIDPESVVPLFHDWIRRGAVEGLLIDVARYPHVPNGPGVILIGHEGDYALDLAEGRPWLRYTLKRDNEGTAAELVERALRRLAGAVAEAADAGIGVRDDAIVVSVYDRLRAPNTPETAAALADPIAAQARKVLGDGEIVCTQRSADPREPFSLRLERSGGPRRAVA